MKKHILIALLAATLCNAQTPPTPAPAATPAAVSDKSKAYSLRPEFDRLGLTITDQGRRGTCQVFGTLEVIEFLYAKTGTPIHPSQEFAAWAANKAVGPSPSRAFTATALIEGIKKYGVCREELCPYKAHNNIVNPSKEAIADGATRKSCSVTWIQEEKANAKKGFSNEVINAICGTIADGNPVTIAMGWNTFFELVNAKDNTIGIPPHNDYGASPGHAVIITGYEKDPKWPGGGRLEIRNSWGTQWGDKGYAWVTFAFLNKFGIHAFAVRAF